MCLDLAGIICSLYAGMRCSLELEFPFEDRSLKEFIHNVGALRIKG